MPPQYSFTEAEIGQDLFYNYRMEVDQEKDLEVRTVPGKGQGLFALHHITPGSFLTEYRGEVIDKATKETRVEALKKIGIRAKYFARLGDDKYIDATLSDCIAKRANHSCTPNCELYTVKIKGAHGGFIEIVALYALTELEEGTELTLDYGDPSSDIFQREVCLCGSIDCRGSM